MSDHQYRLALMHQEDLLEEARQRRIVREALCHRMRRQAGRCFRTRTGRLLFRFAQVLQAGLEKQWTVIRAFKKGPLGAVKLGCGTPKSDGRRELEEPRERMTQVWPGRKARRIAEWPD